MAEKQVIEKQIDRWHADKRVPLALIFAMAVQTAGIVWWAGTLTSRVQQHTADIAALQAREGVRTAEDRRTADILARLDERLKFQTEIMQRLEKALTQRSQ